MNRIKQSLCFYIAIPVLCVSCATLNVDEIKNLDKTVFHPLELKPGYEINRLRIDLIRRTYTENVNDSVTETKDTPYHPLGFDLGNGLFFDLNENLCIKMDYLMGFSADDNFEIHQVYRGNHKRGIAVYKFSNDTLKENYSYGKNLHYRYHLVRGGHGMTVMYKKRTKYSISLSDTSAIYSENRAKPRIIQQAGKDQYDLNIRKRKDHFRKTGSDVFLNKDYIVSLSDDNLTLVIKNPYKKRNNVLYTLVKNDKCLFIYNKRYSGIKIEMNKNNILLYRNNILSTKFELINP
jgi:hypothetical protein